MVTSRSSLLLCGLLLPACGASYAETVRRGMDSATGAVIVVDRLVGTARDAAVAHAREHAETVEDLRAALAPWVSLYEDLADVIDTTLAAYVLLENGEAEAALCLAPKVLEELEGVLQGLEALGLDVPGVLSESVALMRTVAETAVDELGCR